MLKKTVAFVDFNDEPQTEDLYFNMNRTELLDILNMQERLEAFSKFTSGVERDLTNAEIAEMLEIIKILVQRSYGVRSDDGKRFKKSPELYQEFEQSAAYDAFVMSLFDNGGQGAVEFMTGIMPKDLLEESKQSITTVELPETADERPAWIREDRDPTQEELKSMSQSELAEAYRRKMQR